jgi:predicted ArsR family transcriptional regulator
MCAWKGTRPEPVRKRDEDVLLYLKEHGMSSRNEIADHLGLSRSLTYLSLYRLREASKAKRCVAQDTNDLLWTAAVEEPCP